MATVKGVNRTKADDPSPSNILSPGTLGGNVKVMVDQYEAAGLASGSIIQIGRKLPKGAKVVEVVMAYDALGGSTTLILGDAEDDNRYIESVSSASAGFTRMNAVNGLGYETDESESSTLDTQLQITTGGASITGTINVTIFYTFE